MATKAERFIAIVEAVLNDTPTDEQLTLVVDGMVQRRASIDPLGAASRAALTDEQKIAFALSQFQSFVVTAVKDAARQASLKTSGATAESAANAAAAAIAEPEAEPEAESEAP